MKIKKWQTFLAILGGILWMASFNLLELANEYGFFVASKSVAGYSIGFITAFSGFLAWEVFHGRWAKLFGDDSYIGRFLTIIPLIVLFGFGAIGFLNGIINSNPWYYNLTFAIACVVVNQALIPLLQFLDGNR